MGDQEFGKCPKCGRNAPLNRTYYYYDIPCECCQCSEHKHFEIVWHCDECSPIAPSVITPILKDDNEELYKATVFDPEEYLSSKETR